MDTFLSRGRLSNHAITGVIGLRYVGDSTLCCLESMDVAYDPSLVATLVTGLVSLDVVYVGTCHCHIVCLLDEGSGIGPLCHFSDIQGLAFIHIPPYPTPPIQFR